MYMDCIFCKIIAGEISSERVYEDDVVVAIADIAPVAPVHLLVLPKVHIAGVGEITATNAEVVAHIFEVIPQIAAVAGVGDFRVVTNNGAEAGQTVGHLHFHLLGGRQMGAMG